jgi:hypothetical protein
MIWVGGAQGAGKTSWSWQLSRAHDLPLHPVDLWTHDHQARLPAGDSLDEQLAQGPDAAADAFESVSRLRLELVLDDSRARDLGTVSAIVEGRSSCPDSPVSFRPDTDRAPPPFCMACRRPAAESS